MGACLKVGREAGRNRTGRPGWVRLALEEGRLWAMTVTSKGGMATRHLIYGSLAFWPWASRRFGGRAECGLGSYPQVQSNPAKRCSRPTHALSSRG
jgi:hypothetical protein